jgi:hypothetical protein
MLVAPRPYGRFNPFLRLMAPAGQSKARMLAICGGFRSHLCFDDWTDLQRCRFSRQERCEAFVVCDGQGLEGWEKVLRSQRIELANGILNGRTCMAELDSLL